MDNNNIIKFKLEPFQKEALSKLHSGAILNGSVGSGKSLTSLTYYFEDICGGQLHPYKPIQKKIDLCVITTAMKRDKLEWDEEAWRLYISKDPTLNTLGINFTVDSWNNIKKYIDKTNTFFIFDEQRVVGSGAWVKSFLKIAKKNQWILLSATPGDTWMDYIPVFIANGYYKNRTEFLETHVVFDRFAKYPKVKKFINTKRLAKQRAELLVKMNYKKKAERQVHHIPVSFNTEEYKALTKNRWNKFEDRPVKNIGELCYLWRKITNIDPSRIEAATKLINAKDKVIMFYNYDYELELLKDIANRLGRTVKEWNGHKHEPIPQEDRWLYLVQYAAGSEGWNCITTDTLAFYSDNYSYRMMEQGSGRIDRMNTPFDTLHYYHFRSGSPIDRAIKKALDSKKNFNQLKHVEETYS